MNHSFATPSGARQLLALAAACLVAPTATAQSQSDTAIPSAQAVVDRHVAAIGGVAAVQRHRSLLRVGTLEVPSMGITGTYRLERVKPDGFRLAVEMASVGGRVSAFDGTTAWDEERGQRTVLTGAKATDRRRAADFLADLRLNRVEEYRGAVQRVEWQGTACWRLEARTAAGDTRVDFYSVATGLYHGSEETVQSVMGPMLRASVVVAYGTFDGVRLPVEIVQRLPQFDTIIKITETTWDTLERIGFFEGSGGTPHR